GALGHPQVPEPFEVALLDRADGVIEHHQRDALLAELLAEPLGGAATDEEGGIRARAPQHLAGDRRQAGGADERIELVQVIRIQARAVQRDGEQCDGCCGSRMGLMAAGGSGGCVQLSGLSWWKSTAREGTTVEMACL